MTAISGECVLCDQSIGDPVALRIFGDEFYARYETEDGFTAVYDATRRCYCFATLADGRFVSTGVPLHKCVPNGLRRHIKEDRSVRNEKFERRYNSLRPREADPAFAVNRTLGPDDGLLEGRKLTEGDVLGLTIIVDFDDVKTNIQLADVEEILNGTDYSENGNYCSVREYFDTISSGKLNYGNRVVGPIQLSKRRSHYIQNLLVEEVMDKVVNELGVDLSDYDSRGEGIVDAINILYAGDSQYSGDLWPHNSVKSLTYSGTRTHYYLLTGLGKDKVDLRIGTLCHENGHLLCRFPDMYDYGKRDGDFESSQGIGRYCLMGSGNHLNERRTPSPVCSYLRDLVDWIDVTVELEHPGAIDLAHGAYDRAYKYRTGKPNEYFMLENRSRLGLDAHLPSNGLAIYHCDTLGSNEWQDGTRNRHYQCALIQADGHLDLENNRNAGDIGDLFEDLSGIALSHQTIPHSREWDGQDSGLIVSDIGQAGETMEVVIGPQQKVLQAVGEISPNLIIADNNPEGVTSAIQLAEIGTIARCSVSVHIIHSWIGDLRLVLRSPGGMEVILHDRKGADGDDIRATWDSDTLNGLANLLGKDSAGDWQLKVSDNESADVGRLLNWRIELDLVAPSHSIQQQVQPNQIIPDNLTHGIESDIEITQPGMVRGIEIELDIEHDYIGDLQVDLVSPAGQVARLHDHEGNWQHDIKRTYTSTALGDLNTMLGEEMAGEWALHVKDTAPADEGTLRSWGLKIDY